MKTENIIIKGATENNLKNIDVTIPKYKLTALTGVSGSGKSSFVMGVLQKECQRQYLGSMGMVPDGLNKPQVKSIIGLCPSIAVGQRVLSNNPRSTVGTYTEILTYLRILYAKLAIVICPYCNGEIKPNSSNNEIDDTKEKCPHCKAKLPLINMASFAFNKQEGACPKCNGLGSVKSIDYSALIDYDKSIGEGAVSFWNADTLGKYYAQYYKKCGEHYGFEFDITKTIREFNDIEHLVFFKGVNSTEFKSLFPNIKRPKKVMDGYIEGLEPFLNKKIVDSATKKLGNPKIMDSICEISCDECNGTRLGLIGRTAKLNGKTITDISSFTISQLSSFLEDTERCLPENEKFATGTIFFDLKKHIKSIEKIGLYYLSIDRPISTLSGGENQRLRLINILDSGLTGVLYILDEPTTGLHSKDTELLFNSIRKLCDLGNTVLVIEHDMDFVRKCDYVIDFGVGAGSYGGEIVACGTVDEVASNKISKTAQYLRKCHHTLSSKSKKSTQFIEVISATAHNLKNVCVKIPLGNLVSFTGVSGSGKSSLVFDVILKTILGKEAKVKDIKGLSQISDVIRIDQKLIGRMNRSNIATYTDTFTLIRELYSSLPQSKKLKLKTSDFSFNVKGGRCEKCEGLGAIPLDMQFLDDVEVVCPTCKGERFNKKVLSVTYKDKNISDILNSTICENMEFFKGNKDVYKKLSTIYDVGLSYLKLGQPTTTLSGGECQRLKLSKELSKGNKTHILYLLDEPTTGLHPSDTEKLITLLEKLVAQNNSVWVIEHSLDIIRKSDYIIDLGLYGGDAGGSIIAYGTPFEISQNKNSLTGGYLLK